MIPNVVLLVKYYPKTQCKTSYFNNRRAFYSSAIKDDYMNYINKGINQLQPNKYGDYIDYAGNSEKSLGVFDKDGLLDSVKKKIVREHLRTTDSVIWDIVISFEGLFGKEHIKSYEDALALIKRELPGFLKENNISYDNVYWFAGLHENTDNRHIHLSFFETTPTRRISNKQGTYYHHGKLKKLSIENLKVHIEESLTSNEFKFSAYRRNILGYTDTEINKLNVYIDYEVKLKKRILEIKNKIPKGKHYGSKELDGVRSEIDDITTYIINSNPELRDEFIRMSSDLHKHDLDLREICKRSNIDPTRFMLEDKMVSDIYRRCGNRIISLIDDPSDVKGNSKVKDKINLNKLLKRTASLTKKVNYEAINTFLEFRERLNKAEHDRLVEEGVIEP